METDRIEIADIEVGERSRSLDPAKVAAIKASIAEIGLRTPITVTPKRDDADFAFCLVAGGHRLEALKQSGEDFVDAFLMEADDAELWEIDENFARAELTDAQRAQAHARREELLIMKGAVSQPGRGGNRQIGDRSYAAKTADDLGQSKRAVERDLARGKKIAPEVLATVEGTKLDKGVILDKLAATPRDQQAARLAEIRADRSRVKTADDPLNDGEAVERQYAALMAAWNRAGPEARNRFLEMVDGPVFDRGAA